jgi:hypothetical protein
MCKLEGGKKNHMPRYPCQWQWQERLFIEGDCLLIVVIETVREILTLALDWKIQVDSTSVLTSFKMRVDQLQPCHFVRGHETASYADGSAPATTQSRVA